MQRVPIIVIDGGPCGGKSTFLVLVREWLERFDVHPFIISETATELITAGVSPTIVGLELFQKELLLYSLTREDHYWELAHQVPEKKIVILCDRGVLDCAAYIGNDAYRDMIATLGYTHDELRQRYQMIIHLVSAADGAENFYTLANNSARNESAEEARALDRKTQHAWLGHPHQVIIDNSTNFADKMQRALRALARTLNMPEPTEIERKFKVLNFKPHLIPEEAVAVDITQCYLVSRDLGERRVRRRMCSGEASYFYTEKLPTGLSGTRIERERQICESEYNQFFKQRDQLLTTIEKTRYCFPFGGKLFELDVFRGRHAGLVVLEVELQKRDEYVQLPEFWGLEEVTDDPHFKNHALAKA